MLASGRHFNSRVRCQAVVKALRQDDHTGALAVRRSLRQSNPSLFRLYNFTKNQARSRVRGNLLHQHRPPRLQSHRRPM